MKAFISNLLAAGSQILLGPDLDRSKLQVSPGTRAECPANPPLSCQVRNPLQTVDDDSCCLNYPGAQFAQTQFWNSDSQKGPPGYLGPKDSWTIHGLWPDHCDGKFDSVCDCDRSGDCSSRNRKCNPSQCNRAYSSISKILSNFKEDDLNSDINKYWKGITSDESLHQHEWSKHGTCINTLEPKCYENYVETQEVVDYFRITVDLFKTLPTYDWLIDAGITPSDTQLYEREDVLKALTVPRGVKPVLGCQGRELREVWYFFNTRGPLQAANFESTEPNFSGVGGQPGKFCPTRFYWKPKDE